MPYLVKDQSGSTSENKLKKARVDVGRHLVGPGELSRRKMMEINLGQ